MNSHLMCCEISACGKIHNIIRKLLTNKIPRTLKISIKRCTPDNQIWVDHLQWFYVAVNFEQDVSKDVMSGEECRGLPKCKEGF